MSANLMHMLQIGATGFIGQKALRCFGKRDYADVISFVTWCFIGVNVFIMIIGFGDWATNWLNGAKEVAETVKSTGLSDFLRGIADTFR